MFRRLIPAIADLQIERFCGALTLLAIFAVMLAGVVLRYGFSYSLTWYEEFGRYGLILITALGIGAGFKNRTHIVIDNSYLPHGLQKLANILAWAVSLAFICFLAWYSYTLAGALRTRSPAMQIPVSWFYTAFAMLAVLGALRLLEHTMRIRRRM